MAATVRHAIPSDAAAISEIIQESLDEGVPVSIDEPMSPADVESWMRRQGDDGALFVADSGDDIVGFAAVDFDSSQPSACTLGCWVRQRSRRQGHATALAEEAIAFARERGYRRVRGRLPEGNEPALSFLSNIGALVPLINPGATYELPLDWERR